MLKFIAASFATRCIGLTRNNCRIAIRCVTERRAQAVSFCLKHAGQEKCGAARINLRQKDDAHPQQAWRDVYAAWHTLRYSLYRDAASRTEYGTRSGAAFFSGVDAIRKSGRGPGKARS